MAPGFTEIIYDVADSVATVTLNRPDRLNAFTMTMARELVAAVDLIDGDDGVRAAIFTGAGRGFCAGADLSLGGATFNADAHASGGAVSAVGKDESAPRDVGGWVNLRLFDAKKPLIAAINGPAVGVGATMTLPMDVRLASHTAKMGFVFASRGIVPDGCASWFLPRVVGISKAMEWCATGRVFPAAEALEADLVASLHEPDELLGAAQELASEIASNAAPVSVALVRQLLWRSLGFDHPMISHRAESIGVFESGKRPDAMEGITSFLEKRPPTYTGSVSSDLPDLFDGYEEPPYVPTERD